MDIPYTVTARPDTGLYNAKVGIWLFLASEVMLFGGLFSSYIFLRVGADYPWPVHELGVTLGFINTLVLIFSSVTVLLAWANLKLRNIAKYKLYLFITILCAGTFMVIKSIEYRAKFKHYSVTLTDGTILTGHLPHGYTIEFGEVKSLSLTVAGKTAAIDADPVRHVVPWIKGELPKFKTESGNLISLDATSFQQLKNEAKQKATEKAKNDGLKEIPNWTIKLVPEKSLTFVLPPSQLLSRPLPGATAISFRDGTTAEGIMINDKMILEADAVDLRATPDKVKSIAWNEHYLGSAWKKVFIEKEIMLSLNSMRDTAMGRVGQLETLPRVLRIKSTCFTSNLMLKIMIRRTHIQVRPTRLRHQFLVMMQRQTLVTNILPLF